ncbi:extracellular solute-binding protein [Paenibacillus eucommiae]|uniref:Aldouronate transport system substrate-binding protein n=1 Tax=Paenibacillus eucommiae TaxID=1355755 RepID=A0ABS4IY32_9BACL|nr:extracellular solute-binding protein [Paenibacillus eucommiae]MBP1991891.1 putative aldouronate transport system substrate-binding protein [Paenibacillus eucommiae]
MVRFMPVLLAFLLMVTGILSGCSSQAVREQTPEIANKQNEGNQGEQTDQTFKKLPDKYDPPIQLTTVTLPNPTLKYAPEDDENNNPWTRRLEKDYGIKVKSLWSVPPEQYEQKMNLAIASGDIPDFFNATPIQFKQLYEAGLLEDLTTMYSTYVPDMVKKFIDEAGPEVMRSATLDGKLMAIPWTATFKESAPILYVRKDWLKKVNLPEPKTMQDVLKIVEAFATQDPDDNGKDDTVGMLLDKDLSSASGFFSGYHAYRELWLIDSTGKLAYSSIQPEMKTALGKLQGMFKAGQLDPEFAMKAEGKTIEELIAGKAGIYYSAMYAPAWPLQQSKDINPQADWGSYPMPSVDNQVALAPHKLNVSGYWVVKKGIPHPEALLNMLELWSNIQHNNKSEEIYKEFIVGIDGASTAWSMSPIKFYRAFNNVNNHLAIAPFLKGEESDLNKLTPDQRNLYSASMKYKNGDNGNWGANEIWGLNGSASIVDGYLKKNQFLSDEYFSTPTPTMVERWESLRKLEIMTMTTIVQGAPLAEFDKFVEQWKKQGGEQITKEVNEWYAKRK